MGNTYSQMHIQTVITVGNFQHLLKKEWRQEVFKYMAGIIKEKGQKPIIVNGVEDHVHLFFGLKPSMSVSDLMRDVKNNTTNFINEKKYLNQKFFWQEGFGAFSYSKSHVENVYKYILNQEAHHKKKAFKKEYLQLLKKFEIEYDEKYLFKFLDDIQEAELQKVREAS
jgi:putative transposase